MLSHDTLSSSNMSTNAWLLCASLRSVVVYTACKKTITRSSQIEFDMPVTKSVGSTDDSLTGDRSQPDR